MSRTHGLPVEHARIHFYWWSHHPGHIVLKFAMINIQVVEILAVDLRVQLVVIHQKVVLVVVHQVVQVLVVGVIQVDHRVDQLAAVLAQVQKAVKELAGVQEAVANEKRK